MCYFPFSKYLILPAEYYTACHRRKEKQWDDPWPLRVNWVAQIDKEKTYSQVIYKWKEMFLKMNC